MTDSMTSVFLYGAMVLLSLSQVCLIVRIYTNEGVDTILTNKTDNLTNNTEDLHQYIEVLKMYDERFSQLQHQHEYNISELQYTHNKIISELEHKLNVVTSQVSKLEQEISAFKIRQLAQSGAGFTAVPLLRSAYSDGQIIQFRGEIYDGRNNYDNTTGIYTCPVGGMYLFSFEIVGLEKVASTYCINKDNIPHACSYSDGATGGSASLVTHCSHGTQISVSAGRYVATPWGPWQECRISLSTFSGVLIAMDA